MSEVSQSPIVEAQPVESPPQVSTVQPMQSQTDWQEVSAIASLVLGIMNLCSWFFGLCGCPFIIVGIVLGILGLKSEQKTLSIIGLVLSSLSLLLMIFMVLFGVVLNIMPLMLVPFMEY